MDFLLVTGLLSTLTLVLLFYILNPNSGRKSKLPPGPKPYPIIGSIPEIGQQPHQSLAKLSKTYGPLMCLKLGRITTIVVSSPETAKLFLHTHDQNFSTRAYPDSICAHDHHKLSVAWMPPDNTWRKLRRICKEHMFSVQKLDASQGCRTENLQNLLNYVTKCAIEGQVVDIGKAAFTTSLNLMSATLFSMEFVEIGSDSSHELKDVVRGIMELAGVPNLADSFPILQPLDPQGIHRKMAVYFDKCLKIFDEIISQRLATQGNEDPAPKNDVLEGLLEVKQRTENDLSFEGIKHLLLDLFVAGTDTSSGTVEWAMSELMRDPQKMLKLKLELRNVIKSDEPFQESDISRLPYLRAVIKETLRLHPTVPLLLPRKTVEEIEINGYVIPKNAQVLVNAWAIGRDQNVWPEPDLFTPERFMEQETELWGQHFELIPFGAGRRTCVGMPLANRTVHLMLGTLVQKFDWKLEEGLKGEDVDMSEKFGLSLQKAIPLIATPILPS